MESVELSAEERKRIWFYRFLTVASIAAIWEFAGRRSQDLYFALGTPSTVVYELLILLAEDQLHYHFFLTGAEALSGLILGTLTGTTLGLSLWFSKTAAEVSRPFFLGLGTFPVFAFAPLMIIWFGIGFIMKAALAFFATLFVAFSKSYEGATSVNDEHVHTMQAMRASKKEIFSKVIVPGSLDSVLSNMGLNVGLALLGAFIGEFIAAEQGLGYLILQAGNVYNVPRALAATLGIITLAIIFEYIGRLIKSKRFTLIQWISVPRGIWRSRDT